MANILFVWHCDQCSGCSRYNAGQVALKITYFYYGNKHLRVQSIQRNVWFEFENKTSAVNITSKVIETSTGHLRSCVVFSVVTNESQFSGWHSEYIGYIVFPGGAQWFFFLKYMNSFWDTVTPQIFSWVMKTNNFWGDQSDMSATKKTPEV